MRRPTPSSRLVRALLSLLVCTTCWAPAHPAKHRALDRAVAPAAFGSNSIETDCLFGLLDESLGIPLCANDIHTNANAKPTTERSCQELQQMQPLVKANCTIAKGMWRPKQCNPLFLRLFQNVQQFAGCVVKMSFESTFENWRSSLKTQCDFLHHASAHVVATCDEQQLEECNTTFLRYFDAQETFATDSLCNVSDSDVWQTFQRVYTTWLANSPSSPVLNTSYWNANAAALIHQVSNSTTTVIDLVPPMRAPASSSTINCSTRSHILPTMWLMLPSVVALALGLGQEEM